MTPSRPAPSKRRNQSAATLDSRVAGVRWIGGAADESSDSSFGRRSSKAVAAQIPVSLAEQIEEHDRRRDLLRQKLHPRRGGMNAKLQRIEVERVILGDDDFAVEHAARGQLSIAAARAVRESSGSAASRRGSGSGSRPRRERPARESHPTSVRRSMFRLPVIRSTRLASIGKTGGFTGRCIPKSNTARALYLRVNWFQSLSIPNSIDIVENGVITLP